MWSRFYDRTSGFRTRLQVGASKSCGLKTTAQLSGLKYLNYIFEFVWVLDREGPPSHSPHSISPLMKSGLGLIIELSSPNDFSTNEP